MDKYVTYYYGKNEMNQVKVFLIKLPKFKFYSNAKWVSFDWLNDGNLRFVKNNQLDDFLSEYGDVIVNVEEEKNEFGMLNGRRKARIDLNKGKHMERVQWLEFEVELEDGSKQKAKGKVKIFYQGQPVFCKRCSKDHDKKCPAQIKEEESLKDYEMKRQEKCINFTVSDSEFRHANQKALFSDTNVASGAKIGHIANVLENTDLLGYKNIIVNAGLNNMMLNCNTNIEKWQAQLTQEVGKLKKVLKTCATDGKNIRVIPVPDVPITKSTSKAKNMQKIINSDLSDMVKEISESHANSIKMVDVPLRNEEEAFSDNKHFTEHQTAIMLECIDESLPTDEKLIIRNKPKCVLLTTPRIYSGVYSTYRFGCGKCTKLGHSDANCKLNLEGVDTPIKCNKSKRSDRLSSTDDTHKRNKIGQ